MAKTPAPKLVRYLTAPTSVAELAAGAAYVGPREAVGPEDGLPPGARVLGPVEADAPPPSQTVGGDAAGAD